MDGQGEPAASGSRGRTWVVGAVVIVLALAGMRFLTAPTGGKSGPAGLRGDAEDASIALAEKLGSKLNARNLPELLAYANDRSAGLRYASIDALGTLRGPSAAAAVERAFGDSFSLVRLRSLEVLPDIDPDRGVRVLLAALRDDDRWVREAAVVQMRARAMHAGSPVDRRTVPGLMRALDDTSPVVQTIAGGVLRRVTGNPWRIMAVAPEAERQRVIARWKAWWRKAQPTWSVPPGYADVAPILPTRADPSPHARIRTVGGPVLDVPGKPGTITFLNFWGTWCAQCRVELPALQRLDRTYRGRGLQLIGIALGERSGASGLRKWTQASGLAYPTAIAQDALLADFGGIHEVPVSILIDGRGAIRYQWDGERDYETYRAAVERLLAEPAARR